MAEQDVPVRPYEQTAARAHLTGQTPRPKTVTVDFHGHMRIPAADELVQPRVSADDVTNIRYANQTTLEARAKQDQMRWRHLTEVEERLADMDKMALDMMAISCAPGQFYYHAEPSLGAESSQIVNDGIAEKIKGHEKRLVGIATVPLQDTDLAIAELERAINQLGFKGVEVGAGINDEELSTPRLEPFWSKCEQLDIPVFIHPTSFASPRLKRHMLTNTIGNPLETTVAVHYLIFDGVMERHPALKMFLAHGGGFAGAYGARMDHAYGARSDSRGSISAPPSTYLKRFYFDTVVFAVDQLEFLIGKYGTDHILAGTDYPFAMGEYDPVEHVYQAGGLSEADREKICGLNALSLMNLDPQQFAT
ncbi:MAG: amidohydrolase family protein [Rhizobiales bacterium]|nr:amidohydrolase family protein [Hyphomicrobiales bacterium]